MLRKKSSQDVKKQSTSTALKIPALVKLAGVINWMNGEEMIFVKIYSHKSFIAHELKIRKI